MPDSVNEPRDEITPPNARPQWSAPELSVFPAESAETIATPGPEATFTS